jgi:triosephosphate isomerase
MSRLIVANWKMHKTSSEGRQFVRTLIPSLENTPYQVFLAVPFTALASVVEEARGSALLIGAQNIHDAEEGPFTGEICGKMVFETGARFVILGHSERRGLFHETSAWVNRKVKRALKEHLIPLLCIGESEKEREEGKTEQVLHRQLEESLQGLTAEELKSLMIAYEPVWAIGTGKTATPATAQATHLLCRTFLSQRWGEPFARAVPLLYGGSVKPDNIASLMAEREIDGVLVGGASLNIETFDALLRVN